ncbi:LysR family transcriptional regulator [Rhizobiales bacterium]|uniref:LysR substrate-binding domain-containing protein n=1 Tax=Hongsoonwoonella zoysiae TaxID=2821844 RepID=UPI0015600B06|nr:LysR substrate-binding domain-containing protein [Hongsoonwoonella zoysiae]NRG18147.1 LysR family transcriptional regulator [Hongsoonwoonella zoysiae]
MGWEGLPSLSVLRAFEAAARHGSFSAAGRELNVTHAAVAQQVRRLEERLGIPLLYRNGRGIALTTEGEELAASLSESLENIRASVMNVLNGDRNRALHVSVTPAFASGWLVSRLGEFRDENPEIELKLHASPKVADLKRDGFDLTIRFGKGVWPGLESELLFKSKYVMVAAPGLVEGREISRPADLLDYPWLQDLVADEFGVWLAARGVDVTNKANITHLPAYLLLQAARDGQGIVNTKRMFVEDDLRAGRLVCLFEDSAQDEPVGYFLVRRPGPIREPLKKFVAWLKRQAQISYTPSAA